MANLITLEKISEDQNDIGFKRFKKSSALMSKLGNLSAEIVSHIEMVMGR